MEEDRDKQTVKVEVKAFAGRVAELLKAHYQLHYPSLEVPALTISWGRRYAKLISGGEGNRHVYGFVDMTNGNILKAATWKQPAKHARGNIFGWDKGMGCCNAHGIRYL